jgi:hypothetical protein
MLNGHAIKTLFGMISVVSCLGGIFFLQQSRLESLTQQATLSKEQAERQSQAAEAQLQFLQKLPSLGFDNLIADWAFLQFLQYFGDEEARRKTGYGLSPEFFEIIVDRDPRFLRAYPFLSSSVSIYAGKPEKTVELMKKGLQSLSPKTTPGAYYLWRYKATDELLFLGDAQAARRSFEKAAEWARLSSDLESKAVAQASLQTSQFLSENPDSKRAQVNAWLMVLSNAPDQPTQELAIQRIQKLGGQVSISPQGEVKVQLPEQD